MFRQPRFVGAHIVYQTRGPEFVASIIEDVLGPEALSTESQEGGNG